MRPIFMRTEREVADARAGVRTAVLLPLTVCSQLWAPGDLAVIRQPPRRRPPTRRLGELQAPDPRTGRFPDEEPRVEPLRVEVTHVEQTTLVDLDDDTARRVLGDRHARRADLAHEWLLEHDPAWRRRAGAGRPHTLVVDQWCRTVTERPDDPVRVVLVRFTRDATDRPRLLAADSSLGYVESSYRAMADDPGEAVDAEYQEKITAEAQASIQAATQRRLDALHTAEERRMEKRRQRAEEHRERRKRRRDLDALLEQYPHRTHEVLPDGSEVARWSPAEPETVIA